ncbi:hypothetical protein CPC08DRAFT_730898, partial [Agrocybe pediades]
MEPSPGRRGGQRRHSSSHNCDSIERCPPSSRAYLDENTSPTAASRRAFSKSASGSSLSTWKAAIAYPTISIISLLGVINEQVSFDDVPSPSPQSRPQQLLTLTSTPSLPPSAPPPFPSSLISAPASSSTPTPTDRGGLEPIEEAERSCGARAESLATTWAVVCEVLKGVREDDSDVEMEVDRDLHEREDEQRISSPVLGGMDVGGRRREKVLLEAKLAPSSVDSVDMHEEENEEEEATGTEAVSKVEKEASKEVEDKAVVQEVQGLEVIVPFAAEEASQLSPPAATPISQLSSAAALSSQEQLEVVQQQVGQMSRFLKPTLAAPSTSAPSANLAVTSTISRHSAQLSRA